MLAFKILGNSLEIGLIYISCQRMYINIYKIKIGLFYSFMHSFSEHVLNAIIC